MARGYLACVDMMLFKCSKIVCVKSPYVDVNLPRAREIPPFSHHICDEQCLEYNGILCLFTHGYPETLRFEFKTDFKFKLFPNGFLWSRPLGIFVLASD